MSSGLGIFIQLDDPRGSGSRLFAAAAKSTVHDGRTEKRSVIRHFNETQGPLSQKCPYLLKVSDLPTTKFIEYTCPPLGRKRGRVIGEYCADGLGQRGPRPEQVRGGKLGVEGVLLNRGQQPPRGVLQVGLGAIPQEEHDDVTNRVVEEIVDGEAEHVIEPAVLGRSLGGGSRHADQADQGERGEVEVVGVGGTDGPSGLL